MSLSPPPQPASTTPTSLLLVGRGFLGTALLSPSTPFPRPLPSPSLSTSRSGSAPSAAHCAFEAGQYNEPPPAVARALLTATAVIITCPPPTSSAAPPSAPPSLATFLRASAAPLLSSVVLVSTTSLYGDQSGAWVSSSSPLPPLEPGSKAAGYRAAELQLEALKAARPGVAASVFRSGGIYGPGRSALDSVERWAPPVAEPVAEKKRRPGGGPTNRVHVADLAAGIAARVSGDLAGDLDEGVRYYDAVDGRPATRQEVLDHAAGLLGVERREWGGGRGGSKRVDGTEFSRLLGGELAFPDYKAGLESIMGLRGGDGPRRLEDMSYRELREMWERGSKPDVGSMRGVVFEGTLLRCRPLMSACSRFVTHVLWSGGRGRWLGKSIGAGGGGENVFTGGRGRPFAVREEEREVIFSYRAQGGGLVWGSMTDRVRQVDGVLLGMGTLAWSGGMLNAAPFVLRAVNK
ncbi:hypothetical protein TeGR_g13079 [Tetraparma gracilis]|uniref:NAD-dependent epimerase/dehydratase domain-containing protein n=1 Tax=Tetraparma gracilis TaxID=2962635 RepID=A0ABQ6MWV2_9STRA|nr:hypothetical protein TeGR_g13079 [Tetraparma gracilis]